MKTRMDEVGEVKFLRAVLPRLRQRHDVVRGPGDDCAVLRIPGATEDLLVTTDPVIAGHHYLSGTPLDKVARKAVGRALSDIAAMAGTARWILTDVTATADTPAAEIEALYAGLERAARRFGVSIVGGDLAEAAERQVHIVAMGTCPRGKAVLRSTVRPGDLLAVTGRLGASWAPGNDHQFSFVPRLAQGRWLAEHGFVRAMMDLSDGLGTDLPRMLEASGGLGAVVRPEALPCSAAARKTDAPMARAWGDGEDFELLLAVPPNKATALKKAWGRAFPRLPLTFIGMALPAGEGRRWVSADGSQKPFPQGGFDHFAASKS